MPTKVRPEGPCAHVWELATIRRFVKFLNTPAFLPFLTSKRLEHELAEAIFIVDPENIV